MMVYIQSLAFRTNCVNGKLATMPSCALSELGIVESNEQRTFRTMVQPANVDPMYTLHFWISMRFGQMFEKRFDVKVSVPVLTVYPA